VLDQLPVSLHEPLLQARQRPGIDSLRQHEPTPQVAEVNFYDAACDYPNESFEQIARLWFAKTLCACDFNRIRRCRSQAKCGITCA
jgi:hypothetical protein